MRQVASNTYRLGSRSHNFFIITEDGEATVIDAGCSREWSQLVRGLDSLGMGLEAVSAVVVTHGHADHLGFAARAQTEGIDVRIHTEDETRAIGTYTGRFSAHAGDLPVYKLTTWKNFLPMLLAGVTKIVKLERVGRFADDDTLDIPGQPTVKHTPGHTEGHTMFHCIEQGLLFTGDGLITMDLLGDSTGPQMIDPVFNLDTDLAYQSLETLAGVDADLLLPGHGDPWKGTPKAAADKVLANRL